MTDTFPPDDTLTALAAEYGFSPAAVQHLHAAVAEGGGDMAMFDHPEFLGPGQWMRGGLIMITDPTDRVLKNRIDALCNALSARMRDGTSAAGNDVSRLTANARGWDVAADALTPWWPAGLGAPNATGSSGDLAYAWFAEARRLAIRRSGVVELYDTGEHRITGIGQRQTDTGSEVVFTTPQSELSLARLSRMDRQTAREPSPAEPDDDSPANEAAGILDTIEKLAALRDRGVLTEAEFTTKKQELLARL